MRDLFRQFVLALVLVWFPLQSIAAPALTLSCPRELPAHDQKAGGQHAVHSHAHVHADKHEVQTGHAHADHGGGDSGHNCCDLQLSALISIVPDTVSSAMPPQVPTRLPAVRTFISDQPLHPPSLS